jgi:GMP synthase (glutamine-hydrolysing)
MVCFVKRVSNVLDHKGMGLNVKGVDSGDRFLSELAGVSDPETKRKIIGRVLLKF